MEKIDGMVKNKDYKGALRTIREKNPFPLICGWICPAPCELECRRNLIDNPVSINGLKKYVADYEKNTGKYSLPYLPPLKGKKVSVIGGGIEGLTTKWNETFSCPLATADAQEVGIWTGILSMYSPCGPHDGTWVVFIGTPIDYPEMYLAGVQIFVIDEDDAVAMGRALETLNVIGQLP